MLLRCRMLLRCSLSRACSLRLSSLTYHKRKWGISKAFVSSVTSPIRVAIVGSGPSGCYTAKYLQSEMAKRDTPVSIDILERLPTPFGLVRFGVAPDHPEVKNVQNDFSKLFSSEQVNFFGNVDVGKAISIQELRKMYSAVVLAYGCESDRKLNIPGEGDMKGILSAREFVAWYNGHPDFEHIGSTVKEALSTDDDTTSRIAVIGQGNVALDCARILAKTSDSLKDTDIASHALHILKPSSSSQHQREIHVLGRRGHVQASFTIKEVRELTKLEADSDARCIVRQDELDLGMTPSSVEELNGRGGRPKKRIDKLLQEIASKSLSTSSAKTSVSVRFLLQPQRFEPNESNTEWLGSLVCERATLQGEAGSQIAKGSGKLESIKADLALVSIGYKGVAVEGTETWFDANGGILRNIHGRVDGATDTTGGLYVSGWLKRGPSGIIGTNIADAKDTVSAILADFDVPANSFNSQNADQSLSDVLAGKCEIVTWDKYKKIDLAETSEKRLRSPHQPREKFTTFSALLRAATE